jgi:hypothetical protein
LTNSCGGLAIFKRQGSRGKTQNTTAKRHGARRNDEDIGSAAVECRQIIRKARKPMAFYGSFFWINK